MLKLLLVMLLLTTEAHGKQIEQQGVGPTGLPTTHYTSEGYVHDWQSFPTISGKILGENKKLTIRAREGQALVAIFIASWCLPCQKLINNIKELEKKYKTRHTRFVYIFAHDTEADAVGFSKTYKLTGNNLLADVKLMKRFHQPQLPSIYVADRRTWLAWRSLETSKKDLTKLDNFLEYHTAN